MLNIALLNTYILILKGGSFTEEVKKSSRVDTLLRASTIEVSSPTSLESKSSNEEDSMENITLDPNNNLDITDSQGSRGDISTTTLQERPQRRSSNDDDFDANSKTNQMKDADISEMFTSSFADTPNPDESSTSISTWKNDDESIHSEHTTPPSVVEKKDIDDVFLNSGSSTADELASLQNQIISNQIKINGEENDLVKPEIQISSSTTSSTTTTNNNKLTTTINNIPNMPLSDEDNKSVGRELPDVSSNRDLINKIEDMVINEIRAVKSKRKQRIPKAFQCLR